MKFKDLGLGQTFHWSDEPNGPTMVKMVNSYGNYGYRIENEYVFYTAVLEKEIKIEIEQLMFLSTYTGI